jgi:hypothetical protein
MIPEANGYHNLCETKRLNDALKHHIKKMKGIRSTIDTAPPRDMPHVQKNLRAERLREERHNEIMYQNQLLVNKINDIGKREDPTRKDQKTKKGNKNLPPISSSGPPSARSQRQIDEENAAMLKRLQKTRTHYSKQGQLKQFALHEDYLNNIGVLSPQTKSGKKKPSSKGLPPLKRGKKAKAPTDGSQTARGCLEGGTTAYTPRAPPKAAPRSKRPRPQRKVAKPVLKTKNRLLQPKAIQSAQKNMVSAAECPPFDRDTCKCFKRTTHAWTNSKNVQLRTLVSVYRSADLESIYISAFFESASKNMAFAIDADTARRITNVAISDDSFCVALLKCLVPSKGGKFAYNESRDVVKPMVQQHEATKLQARFRGRKDRKQIQGDKDAIVKIQSQIRGKSDRKKSVMMKKEKDDQEAIVKIQSAIRGKKDRKKSVMMKKEKDDQEAIVKIQSAIRGKKDRKRCTLLQKSNPSKSDF